MYTFQKVNDSEYILNDTYSDYKAHKINNKWVMCEMSGERTDNTEHNTLLELIDYYDSLTAEEYDNKEIISAIRLLSDKSKEIAINIPTGCEVLGFAPGNYKISQLLSFIADMAE